MSGFFAAAADNLRRSTANLNEIAQKAKSDFKVDEKMGRFSDVVEGAIQSVQQKAHETGVEAKLQEIGAGVSRAADVASAAAERATTTASCEAQKVLEERKLDALKANFGRNTFDAAASGDFKAVTDAVEAVKEEVDHCRARIEELNRRIDAAKSQSPPPPPPPPMVPVPPSSAELPMGLPMGLPAAESVSIAVAVPVEPVSAPVVAVD